MDAQDSKILEKVKKLLAKANGTDNQEEADTFLKNANRILLKHNLSMSSLEYHVEENSIVESQNIVFGDKESEGPWEKLLIAVLTNHNMCESILKMSKHDNTSGFVSIVGRAENVATVEYLYDVAKGLLRDLAKKAYKAHVADVMEDVGHFCTAAECKKAGTMSYPDPYKRNYLKGAVLGLNSKLETQRAEMLSKGNVEDEGEITTVTESQFELMITTNKNAIALYREKKYGGNLEQEDTEQYQKTRGDFGAADTGFMDGKNLELNKGIDSSSTPEENKRIDEPTKQIGYDG